MAGAASQEHKNPLRPFEINHLHGEDFGPFPALTPMRLLIAKKRGGQPDLPRFARAHAACNQRESHSLVGLIRSGCLPINASEGADPPDDRKNLKRLT